MVKAIRVRSRDPAKSIVVYCYQCVYGPNARHDCERIVGRKVPQDMGCTDGWRMSEPKGDEQPAETKREHQKAIVTRRAQGCADEVTIEIPMLPPSKNEWSRLHWSKQRDMFGAWHTALGELMDSHNYPRVPGEVDVEILFFYPGNERRDRLNFGCFPPLVDALTPEIVTPATAKQPARVQPGLGIIDDDNDRTIRFLTIHRPVVDGTARTIIRIRSTSRGVLDREE